MFDSDWDPEAEDELLAIEAAYAAAKRRSSILNGGDREDSSPAQRRRLPGWANAAAPSGSTRRDLCAGDDALSSEANGSPFPYPTNGLWTPTPCQGYALHGVGSEVQIRAFHGVNLKLRQPALTFGGRTVYSRTTAEVEQATVEILDKIEQLKHNADEISLGFDIEWKPIFRKGDAPRKAAVLQICMESSSCYVMHIFHSGVPPILKSLLEDPSSSKVGIGIAGDATKMSREYNVHVASLVDLSRYANLKLGGTPKSWGLGSLTEVLACKQLLKPNKIRMGNWEVDKLSKEQLHYAATDAFASWYLYQVLKTFSDPKSES